MYKWIMFVMFIGACLLGAGTLFNEVATHSAAIKEDVQGPKKLVFVASDFKFDQTEYKVAKGETLQVKLDVKQGIHAMEILKLGVKLDKANPMQEFTFTEAGTYDVVCTLPCGTGHADMKSKLIVE